MAEWNPFADMEALRQEIDRAFEGFGLRQASSPRVAFLPGRDPQSMTVTAVQNRPTLSGEKGSAGDVKLEAFHRNERASGKFVRTIDLPAEIDEAQIQAEYKNGLLVVTLPKAEKAKPKQITVQVA